MTARTRVVRRLLALAVVAVVSFFSLVSFAHKPSDSYLTLTVDRARGSVQARWDIALRDLAYARDIDTNGDGKLTWAEVEGRKNELADYAVRHLTIRSANELCPLVFASSDFALASHSDGAYAVLSFAAKCGSNGTDALDVEYRLFFDVDAQHRGLLRLEGDGKSRTHVFSMEEPRARFELASTGRGAQLRTMVVEGVLHIWSGYDHVLFLLALLLPSVLRREGRTWVPASSLRAALGDVLRIVSAFTVAHSITLSLAALGVVTLPSRLVESAIAASVVLAALNNLWPVLREDRWGAAFLLGLMHGFGFSSTLMDLELPRGNLVLTLFGFNLGVEIGQLAIVGVFVPLAYLVRASTMYRNGAVRAGSAGIFAIAVLWLVERAFLVTILP